VVVKCVLKERAREVNFLPQFSKNRRRKKGGKYAKKRSSSSSMRACVSLSLSPRSALCFVLLSLFLEREREVFFPRRVCSSSWSLSVVKRTTRSRASGVVPPRARVRACVHARKKKRRKPRRKRVYLSLSLSNGRRRRRRRRRGTHRKREREMCVCIRELLRPSSRAYF